MQLLWRVLRLLRLLTLPLSLSLSLSLSHPARRADATHDYSPQNTGFLMKNWWTWTSSDLVEWTLGGILYPNATTAPPSAYDECWATDGATRNGQYYFYLSLGPTQVGVMASASPTGPWTSPLAAPLLTAAAGSALRPPATFRDPCVFQDDDGTAYIVAGVFDYYIAELNEDMVSLKSPAAPFQLVEVLNPTGPYGAKTDDKPFLHKHGGLYYLSWGCFYGVSSSPRGPFNFTGSVIDPAFLAPAFRTNRSTTGPWYAWEDLADRHGSFWSAKGQTYYASNDRSHSADAAHPSVFRDTVIGYAHYYSNGTIAPVAIDATGVGQYSGSARIEAENFFSLAGARKGHDASGRFGVHGLVAGRSEVAYPHVRGAGAARRVVLRAANGGSGAGGRARVWAGARALCAVALPPTGGWEAYADLSCAFEGSLGEDATLRLTFEGGAEGQELARLDYLQLL